MKKQILVPTDFTKVAECAIGHAIEIAETITGEINLLHVVAKHEDVDGARKKLNGEADRVRKLSQAEVKTIVRIGNIFEDIGDVASEISAELIVMGTHGLRGFQFLTGSHALKVITHSSAPFIVVQEKPLKEGYNNIVVPLDLSKETKQKLEIAANMAEFFDSKIHLITPNETDEYLRNSLSRNLAYAEKYFKERNISYSATVGVEKSGSFDKELIKFAVTKDADLITIMNLQENSLMGMLGSSFEQVLITNDAQIPVMVVNPIPATVSGGSVLFS